jgi:hypothetical protein
VREMFHYQAIQRVVKSTAGYDRNALFAEMELLVQTLLAESGRRDLLKTLLTTPRMFVSKKTAVPFGQPAPATDTPVRVDLSPTTRAGLLTHPTFLAAYSGMDENHPVQRGRFIAERLLCKSVPELPIGTVPELPPPGPGFSVRDRLNKHSSDAACAACHRMMDPLGLPFEMYDDIGRLRTQDAGKPVNATGELEGAGPVDGKVNDAIELTNKLAASPVVRSCFVRQAFRHFMGRDETDADGCTLAAAEEAFARNGDLAELVAALYTSPSFLGARAP